MRATWQGFQSPLAEGIQHFLGYKRSLGQSFVTEEYVLRALDIFLVRRRVLAIQDMNARLIEDFLASRPRKRPRSYNHLVSTLERLFTWLKKQAYLAEIPLIMPKRRETSRRIPFLFTPDQIRQLLACAENLKDTKAALLRGPTYRTIIALIYGLGLRVGEVCRLCIKDVDFEQSLLVINQTKFYKSRLVPFGARMQELLQTYCKQREKTYGAPQPDVPLFSFGGSRPINRHTIDRTFRSLLLQLEFHVPQGVASPYPYHLRHSFAVGTLLRWYRSGIEPQTQLFRLSTFMGHVSPLSTAVYLTITPDLLLEAGRRFGDYAASVIKEAPQL